MATITSVITAPGATEVPGQGSGSGSGGSGSGGSPTTSVAPSAQTGAAAASTRFGSAALGVVIVGAGMIIWG